MGITATDMLTWEVGKGWGRASLVGGAPGCAVASGKSGCAPLVRRQRPQTAPAHVRHGPANYGARTLSMLHSTKAALIIHTSFQRWGMPPSSPAGAAVPLPWCCKPCCGGSCSSTVPPL